MHDKITQGVTLCSNRTLLSFYGTIVKDLIILRLRTENIDMQYWYLNIYERSTYPTTDGPHIFNTNKSTENTFIATKVHNSKCTIYTTLY